MGRTSVRTSRSACQPLMPSLFVEPHAEPGPEPHQWLLQHRRLLAKPLEPPVIGVHRLPQSEFGESPGVSIDQGLYPKAFREPAELTRRRGTQHQVHEMCRYAALGEVAQSLARIRTLACTEYLNLPDRR